MVSVMKCHQSTRIAVKDSTNSFKRPTVSSRRRTCGRAMELVSGARSILDATFEFVRASYLVSRAESIWRNLLSSPQ